MRYAYNILNISIRLNHILTKFPLIFMENDATIKALSSLLIIVLFSMLVAWLRQLSQDARRRFSVFAWVGTGVAVNAISSSFFRGGSEKGAMSELDYL